MGNRQCQHEGVGVHCRAGKCQLPCQRDRNHEDVDQQQIQRKHPYGPAQMALVAVFDNSDLELPRQHHHCQCRQQGQREPVPVSPGRGHGHGLHDARCGRLVEHIDKPVVQHEGREHAHAQEGDQFHDRLERNRRHHTLVAFAGIEMAGPEQDGECSKGQRNIQRGILQDRNRGHHARIIDQRVALHDRDALRDRFELQCDIGHDAENCNDSHDAAEHLAFAIPRGDEIRDRGDALRLADPDHLQQQGAPQRCNQRGTKIDRQKPDPTRSCAPDTAVVGPGGAVDSE